GGIGGDGLQSSQRIGRRVDRRVGACHRRASRAPVIPSAVFALDPMLVDVNLGDVLRVLAKVFVAFALLLVAVMLMIWFERKVIAKMQNRIGPNVAGPWGILQTLADGIKLFFKEDLVPERSDRFVFKLAPYLSLVPAFLTFAVVPIGGNFRRDGGVVEMFGEK